MRMEMKFLFLFESKLILVQKNLWPKKLFRSPDLLGSFYLSLDRFRCWVGKNFSGHFLVVDSGQSWESEKGFYLSPAENESEKTFWSKFVNKVFI